MILTAFAVQIDHDLGAILSRRDNSFR